MPTPSNWGLPLALSLLLHVAAVAGLWYWPLRGSTRLAAASDDITMDFVEEAAPSLEPAGDERGSGPALATPTPSLTGQFLESSLRIPGGETTVGESSSGTAARSLTLGARTGSAGGGTFFQIPTTGQRIVFLLDASASMGQRGAWAAAANELLLSVRRLDPTVRFQVLVYNSTSQTLLPTAGWLSPTEQTWQRVGLALASLPIEGRTDHLPALRHALSLGPDVLFVLTDADDLNAEHLRQVQLLNRDRTIIHTIELTTVHRHQAAMPLQMLARSHRGTYQAIDLARREK